MDYVFSFQEREGNPEVCDYKTEGMFGGFIPGK